MGLGTKSFYPFLYCPLLLVLVMVSLLLVASLFPFLFPHFLYFFSSSLPPFPFVSLFLSPIILSMNMIWNRKYNFS